MSIMQLYAGADGDVLNSTGAQVRDSVNALINTHVAHLKLLPTGAAIQTDTVYTVIALTTAGVSGGGHYWWGPTRDKATHDGSSVIAPEAIAAWDGTLTNIAQLEGWTGTGTGCWVLIGSMLAPTPLGMEGRINLNQLPETNFYLTNNSGVTDLPAGWGQGRYFVQQIGRIKDVYCAQIITNVNANGTTGGNVARQAIRRMLGAGVWSDWFEILNTNSALYKELTPNISNIAALKLRAGAFDNQRVFVSEYNTGTDVGGGSFVWNSTSTVADNGVTVFEVSGVTTGRWIRDWTVLTPEMAGMVGDNSTNNDTAIARLIAFAKVDNTPIHWEKRRYLTGAASIADFHSCTHYGTATINRNGTLWHITPQGVNTNVINVSSSGNATNDGMLPTTSVTIARAIDLLKKYADKANDGIWRIQFAAGTVTFDGIRMDDMPLFRNPVEVWGADVALTAVPTTIWNGATSTTGYAMRQDGGVAAVANWHFKNIKFVNWMFGAGNNGAILVWAQGNVLCENIHCDNMGTGLWFRQCHAKVTHGRLTNVDTWGVGIQYNAWGNIGDLSGGGVYIRGRLAAGAVGISVGRNTVCYIQGNDIDVTETHIHASRLARIRTQANVFGGSYDVCCVWNDTNSVWTPDNSSGYPDTYPVLSESKPAYRSESGATHSLIDKYGQRSLHAVSSGDILTITDTALNHISQLPNGVTFTPFRLPKWFLYSPTFRLDVEIGVALNVGAGGTLALHTQGSSASLKLAEIEIPNVAAYTKGTVKMSVIQSEGSGTARYSVKFEVAGIVKEMVETPNLNVVGIRTNAEDDLLYRLYWTSNNTTQVQIFNMRTYVES